MTKKFSIFIVLSIFTIFCGASFAQEPKEQAEQFLSSVIKGEVDAAYDKIFTDTKMTDLKPQALSGLKTQTKSVYQMYGQPFAYEMIHNEILSPSLRRLVYLLKFELTPTTWEFYFYQAKDKWTLNKITFYDQYQNIAPMK